MDFFRNKKTCRSKFFVWSYLWWETSKNVLCRYFRVGATPLLPVRSSSTCESTLSRKISKFFFFDAATFKVMQNAVHSHILQVSRSFCCREIALFLISEESLLSGQKTSIGRHEHMGGTRPKRLGDLGPIWKVLWNYGIKKNFCPDSAERLFEKLGSHTLKSYTEYE